MARPLMVRVGDLLREPGSQRELDRSVDLGAMETTAAAVIPGTDIDVTALVTAMAGGVEVTGTVAYDHHGACRRCLDDVVGRGEVDIREIAQRDPVDEEVFPIDGDVLDLEPMVRELVLADLPLAPLCADDCAGPAPDRFPTASEADIDPEETTETPPDPRWAVLSELELDSDAGEGGDASAEESDGHR